MAESTPWNVRSPRASPACAGAVRRRIFGQVSVRHSRSGFRWAESSIDIDDRMRKAGMRVLFVDDEPLVLQGIERKLFHRCDDWDIVCVDSGAEALAELADEPFALIGVNSDRDREKAREIVKEKKLNWRSFWNGPRGPRGPIAAQWTRSWWVRPVSGLSASHAAFRLALCTTR